MNDYDVVEWANRSINNLRNLKLIMEANAKSGEMKNYKTPYEICESIQSRTSDMKSAIKELGRLCDNCHVKCDTWFCDHDRGVLLCSNCYSEIVIHGDRRDDKDE